MAETIVDCALRAELVLSYASWVACGLGPSDDRRPLTANGQPLLEVVPEQPGRPVVVVVRHVQALSRVLLSAHRRSSWPQGLRLRARARVRPATGKQGSARQRAVRP